MATKSAPPSAISSKEQARQRAIQDLRARLTSKLKLNAQLQKMASTPNIESTKAKVLKELQLMKSQLQAMVKNVDPGRPVSGNPPPAHNLGHPHNSLQQPQNHFRQPQDSLRQHLKPVNSPAPATQKPGSAVNTPAMKCRHCLFRTTNKGALISHEKGCATRQNKENHAKGGIENKLPLNRIQRAGIKGSSKPVASQGVPKDEVEVVPQAQGNALTFQIKKQSQGC